MAEGRNFLDLMLILRMLSSANFFEQAQHIGT